MNQNIRKIKYILSKDARSDEFNSFISNQYPQFLIEDNPDLILVTGGDGAMLHAIQDFHHLNVPFVGRAGGTLNFLMNPVTDYQDTINALLNPTFNLHTIESTSIRVDILDKEGHIVNLGYAVNEVVLGSHIMGYHEYQILSEDGSLNDFNIKGSGLCICTDLGSTGYNFNLGGPILPLGSNLWSINGVVCNRYLKDILHIQRLTISTTSSSLSNNITVFIDGMRKHVPLENDQTVILNKGNRIKIGFLNKFDFVRKRVDITSRYRKS